MQEKAKPATQLHRAATIMTRTPLGLRNENANDSSGPFCKPLPLTDYEQQKYDATLKGLGDLLVAMLNMTDAKERAQRLRKVYNSFSPYNYTFTFSSTTHTRILCAIHPTQPISTDSLTKTTTERKTA